MRKIQPNSTETAAPTTPPRQFLKRCCFGFTLGPVDPALDWTRWKFRLNRIDSEGKSQAGRQCPVVRQLGLKVQRVELVILIGHVEQSQAQFRPSTKKAVSHPHGEL